MYKKKKRKNNNPAPVKKKLNLKTVCATTGVGNCHKLHLITYNELLTLISRIFDPLFFAVLLIYSHSEEFLDMSSLLRVMVVRYLNLI